MFAPREQFTRLVKITGRRLYAMAGTPRLPCRFRARRTMLTNDQIRDILKQPQMTDREADALCEELYTFLNRCLDEYFANPGFADLPGAEFPTPPKEPQP